MTHRERFLNSLDRKPVDRLPWGDGLWPDTQRKYVQQGLAVEGEDWIKDFDMSWRSSGWINSTANLDFEPEIIEETEETILKLDGNGARLRTWKGKSGTPEHVDFTVKDREGWEEVIKPHLAEIDRRRIPFEAYRDDKHKAAEEQRAFLWHGVAPFEQMHPMCGHEYMLMGMALDPDWVKDMVMTYADMTIAHQEVLFSECGVPDAIWYFEDMGFKEKPFMSPDMYREIVQPGHKKLFDYAHSVGCKVVVHSCGFVEPLVPGLVEAGMDCLQAMEVKAGMDMPRIARSFGDRIAFCGNIDIRIIAGNDRKAIDEEIDRKIKPVLESGGGYIVHSDHSIPPDVEHDTLKYFFERASTVVDRMGT
ncbi:MAG: uroporphyrinogen decarboxylase family protein [Kiritimatiellia bacterium]